MQILSVNGQKAYEYSTHFASKSLRPAGLPSSSGLSRRCCDFRHHIEDARSGFSANPGVSCTRTRHIGEEPTPVWLGIRSAESDDDARRYCDPGHGFSSGQPNRPARVRSDQNSWLFARPSFGTLRGSVNVTVPSRHVAVRQQQSRCFTSTNTTSGAADAALQVGRSRQHRNRNGATASPYCLVQMTPS